MKSFCALVYEGKGQMCVFLFLHHAASTDRKRSVQLHELFGSIFLCLFCGRIPLILQTNSSRVISHSIPRLNSDSFRRMSNTGIHDNTDILHAVTGISMSTGICLEKCSSSHLCLTSECVQASDLYRSSESHRTCRRAKWAVFEGTIDKAACKCIPEHPLQHSVGVFSGFIQGRCEGWGQ